MPLCCPWHPLGSRLAELLRVWAQYAKQFAAPVVEKGSVWGTIGQPEGRRLRRLEGFRLRSSRPHLLPGAVAAEAACMLRSIVFLQTTLRLHQTLTGMSLGELQSLGVLSLLQARFAGGGWCHPCGWLGCLPHQSQERLQTSCLLPGHCF